MKEPIHRKDKGITGMEIAMSFIGVFIAMVLIFQLWPTFSSNANNVQNDNNTAAGDKQLFLLIPTMIIIGLIIAVLGIFVFSYFKGGA